MIFADAPGNELTKLTKGVPRGFCQFCQFPISRHTKNLVVSHVSKRGILDGRYSVTHNLDNPVTVEGAHGYGVTGVTGYSHEQEEAEPPARWMEGEL